VMDAPSTGHLIAAAAVSTIALGLWLFDRRHRRRAGKPSSTNPNPRPARHLATMTASLALGLWVLYLVLTISPSVADGFFGVPSTTVLLVAVVINLVVTFRTIHNGPYPRGRQPSGVPFSAPLAGLTY
ncbi:hypothetical protein, partial [Litorihabitans aurantiacus]|uniref:hypothetical protein n=1 Tax=Litorihabitans aurantiacus TaxID=1930061 RepID=UPI0024E09BE6